MEKAKELIFTHQKNPPFKGEIKRPSLYEARQIMDLQENILSKLVNPNLFALTDLDQIEESLNKDYCLGIYDKERLIAFGLLIINRPTPRHTFHKLTNPQSREGRSVTVDSIFVEDEYRGYGIQQKLFEAFFLWAQAEGVRYMHTTIDPQNSPSLNNALKMGYHVVETKEMYGGKIRHILEKEIEKS